MKMILTNIDSDFFKHLSDEKYENLPIPELVDIIGLNENGKYYANFSEYPATAKWLAQLGKMYPNTSILIFSERKMKIDGFKLQEWKKKESINQIIYKAKKLDYEERYDLIFQHAEKLGGFFHILKKQFLAENDFQKLITISDFERMLYKIDSKILCAELCFLMEE